MDEQYRKEFSASLGRDMEFKTYGHGGLPAIVFPCMAGRFWDYAEFGMVEAMRPWLDAGRLRLITVDSIDNETWNSGSWDKAERARQQERYFHYLVDELVPRVHAETGWADRLMVTGNSMGGYHAAICMFRRPDLFGWMISLSGVFDPSHFFGDYSDPVLYDNSPAAFVAGMPDDHPYLDAYRHSSIVAAIGQGAWEESLLPSNHHMAAVLRDKNVGAWFDFWGPEWPHDWPTWHAMMPHYLGQLLRL